MRVVLLAEGGDGGAERVASSLARRLPALGVEVQLLAPVGGGEIAFADLEVLRLPRTVAKTPIAIWRLHQIVRSHGADIIHTHGPRSLLWARLAAGLDRHPTIVAHRHVVYPLSTPLRRLATGVTRWIVVCEASRRRLIADGISRDRIDLVWPASELVPDRDPAGATRVRAELEIPNSSAMVLVVGRLEDAKNPLLAIEAVRRASAAHPLALVFAGSGALRDQVLRAGSAAGVELRCLGDRSDIARLLAAADLVLHPSRAEAIPLVLLEASAAGVPLVATAVGGVPELWRHGIEAWLAPSADAVGLAAGIRATLEDPGATRSRTAAAQARVAPSTPTALANGCLASYRRAIASRRSA